MGALQRTLSPIELLEYSNSLPLVNEALDTTSTLSPEVAEELVRMLQGIPANTAALLTANCMVRRGFGGRQAGPDPRNVPGLSAAKARRILAKRESAARSNFKKKAAALAEGVRQLLQEVPTIAGATVDMNAVSGTPHVTPALTAADSPVNPWQAQRDGAGFGTISDNTPATAAEAITPGLGRHLQMVASLVPARSTAIAPLPPAAGIPAHFCVQQSHGYDTGLLDFGGCSASQPAGLALRQQQQQQQQLLRQQQSLGLSFIELLTFDPCTQVVLPLAGDGGQLTGDYSSSTSSSSSLTAVGSASMQPQAPSAFTPIAAELYALESEAGASSAAVALPVLHCNNAYRIADAQPDGVPCLAIPAPACMSHAAHAGISAIEQAFCAAGHAQTVSPVFGQPCHVDDGMAWVDEELMVLLAGVV